LTDQRSTCAGNADEIYCELVRGLGESLVSGTVPGSALSFVAPKSDLSDPEILTFPSKSNGMFVPESLIFRSDSNGEDLAGYAGAGLYESITMDPTTLEIVDFSEDQIQTDLAFRKQLLSRICEVGKAIEDSMGSAQDIEGVVDPNGNITVVQTRPQV
jgi:alpha-glucan, water dikinase